MKKIGALWQKILENDSTLFYRSKKAVFLFFMVTVVSSLWPSYPDGSIIDIIWSHFYIIGPSIIFILVLMMFLLTIKNEKDR